MISRSPGDGSTAKRKKRAANVTVDGELFKEARELGINLSRVLEQGLIQELRRRRQARWLEENREAIDHYNARVERRGVFSDGLRRF